MSVETPFFIGALSAGLIALFASIPKLLQKLRKRNDSGEEDARNVDTYEVEKQDGGEYARKSEY